MKKVVSLVMFAILVVMLMATPGFALTQDPLILDLESLTYGANQETLIVDANFVNTSANVITLITDVELEITDGARVIASGTMDISKQKKTFTMSVGSATPWQFILQNPVKGADLSKGKIDSRITYNSLKGTALPAGKKIYYNGIPIAFDVPPTVINGRLMIPARAVFEKMNCAVTWNAESQTVDVFRGSRRVIIPINKDVIIVDGKSVKLDVAATILNGRTLVPLRAISNALGGSIVYGELNEMAVIYE